MDEVAAPPSSSALPPATVADRIAQIAVPVHDIDRAKAFYRDVLGLAFLFEFPGLAFFDIGGVRLMLSIPEEEFDHPASIIYYRVADLDAAYARIHALDIEFIREPHLVARMPDHELWMAFLRDPAGNTLALMEERRPA
jgi:methylmalonyl-CoA/ethylmalonyl-CoA epimerase